MAGSCEYSDVPLGSLTYEEFFYYAATINLSRKIGPWGWLAIPNMKNTSDHQNIFSNK